MSKVVFDLIDDNNLVELNKLLEKKIDLHVFDTSSYEDTPLHKAVRHKQKDIIELLLKYHAPINAKNNFGDTPLHLALLENYTEGIRLLLAANPDLRICNSNNKSVLALANELHNTSIQEYISQAGRR